MSTLICVNVTREDLLLFTRPGLDLRTGQVLELAAESPRQLDLFRPAATGRRLPLHKILQSLGDRCASAYREGGDRKDQTRARAYHAAAIQIAELPSGHPLFEKLWQARAVGGELWSTKEKEFCEGWGAGADLSTVDYYGVLFPCVLESLLDEFLTEHA